MSAKSCTQNRTGRASVAIVGIGIGVGYLLIGVFHDQVVSGVIGLLIMIGYVALLYGLRRRSESAELLSANPGDERQRLVVLNATALTGQVLIAVLVGGLLVSMVIGSRYAVLFGALCAVGGACFIGATVWFSRRI